MKKLKIMFTGGGTAGHVTPNVALIEYFQKLGWDVVYVGSLNGIEREIIANSDVRYLGIASGKLRRYFDWANFIDPVRIFWGCLQSIYISFRERPNILFSKGGFVAVPVVFAAWLLRIPVISHESDVTPGLANRLCYPFVKKLCVNFPETKEYLGSDNVIVTGSPVRQSLLYGRGQRGIDLLGFSEDKPIILVFGGSLGATTINRVVRDSLHRLLSRYQVVHITGSGNLDKSIDLPGYQQWEFLDEDFGDVLAASSVVVSRAGANSIYELLVTRKPHILIPLSSIASRGDQLVNAETFAARGYSRVLLEENFTCTSLTELIDNTYTNRSNIVEHIEKFQIVDSLNIIGSLIEATVNDC